MLQQDSACGRVKSQTHFPRKGHMGRGLVVVQLFHHLRSSACLVHNFHDGMIIARTQDWLRNAKINHENKGHGFRAWQRKELVNLDVHIGMCAMPAISALAEGVRSFSCVPMTAFQDSLQARWPK